MSVPEPATLMGQIDATARMIDTGSKQLGQAIRRMPELQANFEEAFQTALLLVRDEARTRDERMPAEDLRKALAHRKVPKEIYAAFLECQAEVDALKAWLRAQESTLSARQSLLKALQMELGAS